MCNGDFKSAGCFYEDVLHLPPGTLGGRRESLEQWDLRRVSSQSSALARSGHVQPFSVMLGHKPRPGLLNQGTWPASALLGAGAWGLSASEGQTARLCGLGLALSGE